MESDIERGLDRRGWTRPVDDIVTTSSNLASMRVRDAVIVAKAWKDGASPSDAIIAWSFGRKDTHTHYIERRDGRFIYHEPVAWLDDVDLLSKKCFCLGPRALRGFEMFTIGDCQSLLLKLTNERCVVRIGL